MENEKLESLLIDYIDGKLNSVDTHFVEQELMKNPASFRMYEELKEVIRVMGKVSPAQPSAKMRAGFEAMVQQEISSLKTARTVAMRPWWYAVAAGVALLITGLSIGLLITERNRQAEQVAAIEAEKAHTRQVVSRLSDQQSPGNRILAVKEASSLDNLNAEIIGTLIRTMDNDPNSNVRLAAMEALAKFSDEPAVRKALVSSLARQSDPVVQIALIQLIVELRDKEAVEPLQHIIENDETLESVKDEAHLGILVLS
jgi:hypothetical protein